VIVLPAEGVAPELSETFRFVQVIAPEALQLTIGGVVLLTTVVLPEAVQPFPD
jgi:hypothetical protein